MVRVNLCRYAARGVVVLLGVAPLQPALLQAADKAPAVAANQDGAYLIGPGDVLDISVWKDEALTRTVVVLPDGRISFPLVGELQAGGRSIAQLKGDLEKRLLRYVPDLVLSLEVKQSNSLLVYVIGKVNTPGRQSHNAPVNVLQALATAGGMNPFAKRDKVRIFRTESGVTRILPFDYDGVTEGERLEENIPLRRGDVVVVP